jgi:hypothetical protein
MTDEEVIAAAKSDPDNPPLTREQLKSFKIVRSPKTIDVKAIRIKLR